MFFFILFSKPVFSPREPLPFSEAGHVGKFWMMVGRLGGFGPRFLEVDVVDDDD